jgi:DNA adenine methylase
MNKAQPFLKWAGGKTQLLPELVRHVPTTYGRYVEPFVGGGALFFHLQPKEAVLADLNEELINTYRVVRDGVDDLIAELKKYVNDEDFYYEVRDQDPKTLDPLRRAARTIYLNKTCYNGLYRVNKAGEFNVPFGRRKNPSICDESTLLAAHRALQGVELVSGDYKDVLREYARPGDFVYLDPPYYPVGGYADFKRFTKEFFYEEDHIELRNEFRRLADLGCQVLLTNSNTPFVRRLYDGFEYQAVDTRRNISSKPSTRTGEDLIVIATKPPKQKPAQLGLRRQGLLENFPGTRFMGSKYQVLPFLWQCVKDLHFRSVLDAFSGSGCVSYMFKQYGMQVISNDFLHFAYHFARAMIENTSVQLDDNDIEMLMQPNANAGTFIAETFRGLYFNDEENAFLDSLRANIELFDNEYKKSLALAAITRACMKRRSRGIFTFVGDRYNDGRRDLQIDLKQHFLENVQAFNGAVFDNEQENLALNEDVFDLDVYADLVYLDPPYYTPRSDNDYTRRYHFVEGLVRQWEGVKIQHSTKTKKFKRYETPFISKDTVHDAFDRLFAKFRDSILVVSYSSNSIPDKADLVGMLKKYKPRVRVYQVEHLYSFGTHAHMVGKSANRVREYVFVAY